MTKLAATLGIAFGIREVDAGGRRHNGISNRLKLVTSSTEQLTQAQEQLYKISQKPASPSRRRRRFTSAWHRTPGRSA